MEIFRTGDFIYKKHRLIKTFAKTIFSRVFVCCI